MAIYIYIYIYDQAAWFTVGWKGIVLPAGETLAMVHDVEQKATFPQGPGYEKIWCEDEI